LIGYLLIPVSVSPTDARLPVRRIDGKQIVDGPAGRNFGVTLSDVV